MSRLTVALAIACAVALTPVHAATEPTPEQVQAARVRQAMLMSAMFDLRKSRMGFDETVAAIRFSAERRGWRVGPTQDASAAMTQAGVKDAPRIKVIPTCPPEANQRLASVTIAQGKPVPPLPCRITVLVDKDKQVQIVKINTAHLARAAKGDALARVMGEIAAEEEAMLKGIVD
jgi:uncharacterized protein (DUF302 family)